MSHALHTRTRRAALLVTIGIAVGAALAYRLEPGLPPGAITGFWRSGSDPAGGGTSNATAPAAAAASERFGSSVPRGSTVSDRLAAYSVIASTGDAATLEARLADTAAQVATSGRDFEIGAVLARLSDLDALRTFSLAQNLGLNDAFLATLARGLVESNIRTAPGVLRSMTDPAAARRVALGLLDRSGYGSDAIDRLAAALPTASARLFLIEALERKARIDGYGAFRAAVALDGSLRAAALARIGVAWAEHDPYAAMASTENLPDDLVYAYGRQVMRTWARTAPQSLIRYLETAEIGDVVIGNIFALQELILAHPDSERTIIPRLPLMYRDSLLDDAR